jgi:hypothetical protein
MGGGQYGKGPIALPETNLCKFIKNDTVVYPSMKRASNLPKTCPFKKVNMPFVKALQALGNSIINWSGDPIPIGAKLWVAVEMVLESCKICRESLSW